MDPITLNPRAAPASPARPAPGDGVGDVRAAERQAPPGAGSDAAPAAVDAGQERRIREECARMFQGTELEFEFAREQKQVVVRVFDKASGTLLREIPPGELLKMARYSVVGKGKLISRAV